VTRRFAPRPRSRKPARHALPGRGADLTVALFAQLVSALPARLASYAVGLVRGAASRTTPSPRRRVAVGLIRAAASDPVLSTAPARSPFCPRPHSCYDALHPCDRWSDTAGFVARRSSCWLGSALTSACRIPVREMCSIGDARHPACRTTTTVPRSVPACSIPITASVTRIRLRSRHMS